MTQEERDQKVVEECVNLLVAKYGWERSEAEREKWRFHNNLTLSARIIFPERSDAEQADSLVHLANYCNPGQRWAIEQMK